MLVWDWERGWMGVYRMGVVGLDTSRGVMYSVSGLTAETVYGWRDGAIDTCSLPTMHA